jgi:hypothetical protein
MGAPGSHSVYMSDEGNAKRAAGSSNSGHIRMRKNGFFMLNVMSISSYVLKDTVFLP